MTLCILSNRHPHFIILSAGKPRLSPTTVVVNKEEDQPSFNCTVEYTGPIAPNITWSYISKGVEKNIACKNPNYKIAQNPPQRENGTSILCSTLTFLNLDMIENQDIVVVRCRSGPGAESDAHLVKITGTCKSLKLLVYFLSKDRKT